MAASSQTTGAEEIIRRFEALEQAARTRIAHEALEAGAAVVLDEQRLRAEGLVKSPERTPKTTALALGAIREDLQTRFERTDAEGYAACLIGPGDATAHVAIWVEYGHRLVKGGYSRLAESGRGFRGPGKEIGDVSPELFLRPAYEASAERAAAAVNEREWQIIEETLA